MVEALLVGEQLTSAMIDAGRVLVKALDKSGLKVRAAFWFLLPEERVWRLYIVSPEVRTFGPRAVYRKVRSVMGRHVQESTRVETKDISVLDDGAPLYLLLRSFISTGPDIGGVRCARNVINGQFVEDAYLYRMT